MMRNKLVIALFLCMAHVSEARVLTDTLRIFKEIAAGDTTEYGEDDPFKLQQRLSSHESVDSARIEGQLNGMDYTMERRRIEWGEEFTRRWDDHLFLEVGIGIEKMVPPDDQYHFEPLTTLHLGIGKQFHKYHSIRFLGEMGYGYRRKYHHVFYKLLGKLDYLFSLSSYLYGYNPSRLLDASAVLGGGLQLSSLRQTPTKQSTSAEGHLGVQLRFFTGPQGYFNIEPYIGLATDGMDVSDNQNWRGADVFYGARLSYIYYIHNNLSKESRQRFFRARKDPNFLSEDSTYLDSWRTPWFLEFANGLSVVSVPHSSLSKTMGQEISMSVGKWLSPVIGLRVSASARVNVWSQKYTPEQENPYRPAYEQDISNLYVSGRVEALFNPFGFSKNYYWNTQAGLYLVAGAEMGRLERYETQKLSCRSESYDMGVHLWTRLTDGLQLFLEPRWSHNLYRISNSNVQGIGLYADNTYTFNMGLTVFSKNRRFRPHLSADEKERPMSLIAGVAGGYSFFHTRMGYDDGKNASLFAEFHMNHYAGVRLSCEYVALDKNCITSFYDYANTSNSRVTRQGMMKVSYGIAAGSLDLSLNMLNTLYGYKRGRLFDFYLYVGPTFYHRMSRKGKLDKNERLQANHTVELVGTKAKTSGIGANGGLRLQCNLSRHVGVFFSPHVYVMLNDMMPEYSMLRIRYMETLSLGVHCKI